jgi:hypothetical protein
MANIMARYCYYMHLEEMWSNMPLPCIKQNGEAEILHNMF